MDGKKRIILAFCACIVLLAGVGSYSYFNTRRYFEASRWVYHSQEVINEVKNIYAGIQGIETSQRGYVIAGEHRFLIPFNTAVSQSKNACLRAKSGVHDNPEQLRVLKRIDQLLEEKIAFATRVVELRRESGFDAAQQMMLTYEGEELKDNIRREIARFTKGERALLDHRLEEAKERFEAVIAVIILMVVLSIVIMIGTLYLFIKDYNRRVRSEEQVRESEVRFKMMLEAMPIGVFVIRPDGSPYYSNRNAGKILGMQMALNEPVRAILGKNEFYFAGTDKRIEEKDSPVTKALKGEPCYNVDNIELLRDGQRTRLRVHSIPLINSHGGIDFVISLFEDISDIKKAENDLVEAKLTAEQSLILKETFLANMSHEIRTPMNAILGFTDLLLKEPISEKERDYVDTIRTAGENLLRIINDILDLSKIEANMMEFEEHPLNIPDIFRSLHTMLAGKAKEKKLDLSFKCDPRLSATLIGDPTRLTQIIINLVGNAIKFTKKGSVTVEAFLVDQDREGSTVDFAITDTGIGIAPDKLSAIFERFRQAESYTTRSYGGTGLGLSIARQLVELQNGKMEITSEVDKGSCFSFRLHFAKAKEWQLLQEKKEKHIVDFDRIRQMSVLMAEDNPINVKLIRNLFDMHQIAMTVAENGYEVIDLLKERTFDLVLMDLEMPVMNGYETTRIIREEMHLQVPIVAMTAHAMAGEQEKCLQLGMNDFVSKPINITQLFEKMDQIAQTTDLDGPVPDQDRPAPVSPAKPAAETVKGRIDLSYLQELSSGNRSFEKEMLSLFMQQIPTELEEMKVAHDKHDFATVRNLAHKMKSSVPLVGANYLVPLLNRLEDDEGEMPLETYSEVFHSFADQLEACFDTVSEELATY
jgi:PAS domain S-box-containing protein